MQWIGGRPARGTEMSSVCYQNTSFNVCSLCVQSRKRFYVILYVKSLQKHGRSLEHIGRYSDSITDGLLFVSLILVHPIAEIVKKDMGHLQTDWNEKELNVCNGIFSKMMPCFLRKNFGKS